MIHQGDTLAHFKWLPRSNLASLDYGNLNISVAKQQWYTKFQSGIMPHRFVG